MEGVEQLLAYYRNAKRKKKNLPPYICVYFCGSGDSGGIEDVYFSDDLDDSYGSCGTFPQEESDFLAKPIERGDKLETVKDLVEDIAYDWITSTGVDWYNNSGGGGHFHLEYTEGKLIQHLNVWQNMIESKEVYSHKLTI